MLAQMTLGLLLTAAAIPLGDTETRLPSRPAPEFAVVSAVDGNSGEVNLSYVRAVTVTGFLLLGLGRARPELAGKGGEEDPPKGTITLKVEYSTNDYKKEMAGDHPNAVLVTLISKGRAIRSRELRHAQWATWKGLPAGDYELHVEAEGYARCVKHLTLSEEDKDITVHALVGRTPLILGAGPSLEELLARLKKSEEQNAGLKATVDQLRKDIEQLKRK
jgi:hypothetical protein